MAQPAAKLALCRQPSPSSSLRSPQQPALPMGQQQAVESAQSYIDMGGFSRTGLVEQLVYEGFSSADAEFAVNYINPDWNAQAAQSAKSYIDMGGFSRQALIEQLVYEGFTQAQAAYGASAVATMSTSARAVAEPATARRGPRRYRQPRRRVGDPAIAVPGQSYSTRRPAATPC